MREGGTHAHKSWAFNEGAAHWGGETDWGNQNKGGERIKAGSASVKTKTS